MVRFKGVGNRYLDNDFYWFRLLEKWYYQILNNLFLLYWPKIKLLGTFLIGLLLLWITIPGLISVITKDFDIITGKCTIEISTGRFSNSDFYTNDTVYMFDNIPELNAYEKSTPYYCEITVTQDYLWEIDYKIFDLHTRKLLE